MGSLTVVGSAGVMVRVSIDTTESLHSNPYP